MYLTEGSEPRKARAFLCQNGPLGRSARTAERAAGGRPSERNTTHMNIIVAGQSIVTGSEFLEVAAGFGADVELLNLDEEFTAGGLASRDALESFLADFQVET